MNLLNFGMFSTETTALAVIIANGRRRGFVVGTVLEKPNPLMCGNGQGGGISMLFFSLQFQIVQFQGECKHS